MHKILYDFTIGVISQNLRLKIVLYKSFISFNLLVHLVVDGNVNATYPVIFCPRPLRIQIFQGHYVQFELGLCKYFSAGKTFNWSQNPVAKTKEALDSPSFKV